MQPSGKRRGRQQMELLGAAEERRLFSADSMAACMHWPAAYSVDSADWVTEATASFLRPMTPRRRLRASAASQERAQQQAAAEPPLQAQPEDVGLFSAELLPSRSVGGKLAAGPPPRFLLQTPQACQPALQKGWLQPQSEAAVSVQQHVQQQQPLPAAAAAAGLAATTQQQQQQPLRRASALQSSLRRPDAGPPAAAARSAQGVLAGPRPPAPVSPGAWRRTRSSRQQEAGVAGASGVDRQTPQTLYAAAAPAAPAPAAAECSPVDTRAWQQLLQKQRDVLRHQFEGIEKLRLQLQELETELSLLQLQVDWQQQKQQMFLPPSAPVQQQDGKLGVSDLQPPGEDEEGEDGQRAWSLDPRDYRQMSADLLEWIPAAGMPSVSRRIPSQ
ncbi:hypothetical protein Efla_005453 [Eimeria flavescens]